MSTEPTILVTGAAGQLGQLVLRALLDTLPAERIYAMVRSERAAASVATLGVHVRIGDYAQAHSLDAAFAGIGRALLISSNQLGQRAAQHANVIAAAKRAGVGLLAYTSLLHADTSPLGLAEEHRQSEAALRASGVPFVVLRNGWYTENYTAAIPAALTHGALFGSAGAGRISSAARADYAAAAAAVLTAADVPVGRIYELAGDSAYTLAQFAAELSAQTHRSIAYHDLPESEYKAALLAAGLPEPVAALLSDSDNCAARDALFDDKGELRALIGRPTTPFEQTIAAALAA
jgi:NAD(P)H dehydrogenase (quinone)